MKLCFTLAIQNNSLITVELVYGVPHQVLLNILFVLNDMLNLVTHCFKPYLYLMMIELVILRLAVMKLEEMVLEFI